MKSVPGLVDRLQRISFGAVAFGAGLGALVVLAGAFMAGLMGLQHSARVHAEVLAHNLSAAVAFQDDQEASVLLQSLEHDAHVTAAQLRQADGTLLAIYSVTGQAWRGPTGLGSVQLTTFLDRVEVQQPVEHHGVVIGQLAIAVSMFGLYGQMGWVAVALWLLWSLITAVVAWRLKALNTLALAPLADLQAVMAQAASDRDAPRRAGISGIAEFDAVAVRFNDLLDQIQVRDARLVATHKELEVIVSSRTQQLAEAMKAAEAASAAKSEFLATMSHEIRTPMSGVLGMNELLVASDLKPQQRLWAEAVQSSGHHLLRIINDILDFSRIESGQLSLQPAEFDLSAVVEETLSSFARQADSKGVELVAQFSPPDASLWVLGDPLRLRQVLINLIGNAVKFTETGEVVVRVTERAPLDGQPRLTIAVQDTGIGIEAEVQSRVFEQFEQADGSTTRDFGGSGLGLSISRQLLGLMGGAIRVESQLGRGSVFTIDLPLPRAAGAAGAALPRVVAGGHRVLVVDVNATVRDTLSQWLVSMGLDAASTDDAATALNLMLDAAASGSHFDLVILGAQMPDMADLQLGDAIRSRPSLAGTTLLYALSTRTEIDPQALHDSAVLCLQKPVSRSALRQAVVGVLAASRPPAVSPVVATAPAGLQGRVLLVEDNPINQRVGKIMLQKLGLTHVLAENGEQALQRLGEGRFDLVLMDCQMPVMDGYAATAAIRRLPGHDADHLPIVALTANVIRGDEQRCLDVGMNAFLAKPYSLAALRGVLETWLKPAPGAATTCDCDGAVAEPQAEHIDNPA